MVLVVTYDSVDTSLCVVSALTGFLIAFHGGLIQASFPAGCDMILTKVSRCRDVSSIFFSPCQFTVMCI